MVDMPFNQIQTNYIYIIYMSKEDLALDSLQWLIYHETQTNPNHV